MDINELYQEVILDHSKKPRNFRHLPQATHHADGYNPMCGDQVHVQLIIEGDTIKDATFEGCGCAISTASASMMTEMVRGKNVTEIQELSEKFREVLVEGKEHEIGDLEVLCGVKAFPTRVKCATLAWHAVIAAINNSAQPATTE